MAQQVFDTLQRARFGGELEFPVSHIEVIGGLRDHIHEYPHAPGGAPEKLGRKLYEVHMTCPFVEGTPRYPNLFSQTLPALRQIFETGFSSELLIPTVGTIIAYCTSWREVADPKSMRNGVMVDLTFREDQSNLFLVTELVAKSASSFSSALSNFNTALADQESRLADALTLIDVPDPLILTPIPSLELVLFQQIASAAATLIAEIGSDVAFGAGVAGAANDVVTLCQTADATSSVLLTDPTRAPLLDALQDVWAQASSIANDALQTKITVIEYTVPNPGQPVTAISTAIYGDSSHAIELMQTNPIEDPFLVPGGTVLKAYLFATTSAAA